MSASNGAGGPKTAYVTTYDARDPAAFGGRGYHMARHMARELETTPAYIGPLSKRRLFPLLGAKHVLYGRLLKRWYTASRDRLLIRDFARQISSRLSRSAVDVVFSAQSPGSQPIAYLECEQPIAFWTDATFAGAIDFYPGFSSDILSAETLRDGLANEKAALQRCSLAVYSSDWAAQTAIDHYGADPSKVKVVPYGPNFDRGPGLDDVRRMIDARPTDTCRLLFIGVDWYRKGGDLALEVARRLNESGLRTELTAVGCRPLLEGPLPSYLRPLGYLDKATPEGAKRFDELLAASHFLVLPTKADASPHVLCEAAAFGVPALTTAVGGIPTIVRDGVNGYTFDPQASADDYCRAVTDLFAGYSRYREMALAAFNEYESRLNWTVAARTVKRLLAELVLS
jgi:glycosyltransferase involved in cell wall biosynthesis